jgi:hypothetical protein
VLLQLQDPRAGASADEVLSRRRNAAERRRSLLARLPAPLRRGATGLLRAAGWYRRAPIARETNRQLLAGGVVRRALDLQEIWAVTDFHVPGQPGALGTGVDVEAIRRGLGDAVLADTFTYEFFGRPAPDLTAAERLEEEALFAAGDPHGAQFGTAWKVP